MVCVLTCHGCVMVRHGLSSCVCCVVMVWLLLCHGIAKVCVLSVLVCNGVVAVVMGCWWWQRGDCCRVPWLSLWHASCVVCHCWSCFGCWMSWYVSYGCRVTVVVCHGCQVLYVVCQGLFLDVVHI